MEQDVSKYPFYPELNEAGNDEAQMLMDKFKADAKKVLDNLLDDYLGTVYTDLLPSIESDSWTNYRNKMMDGFRNYNNRLVQSQHDFKTIRQEIYKEFRDDIVKDLDQDNLQKISELQIQIKYLQESLHNRY